VKVSEDHSGVLNKNLTNCFEEFGLQVYK
jgi:hypothetical protein